MPFILETIVPEAKRAYEQEEVRFEVGSIAHVQLLVTQTRLLDSRSANAQSQVSLTNAQVDQFRALGGSW